MDKRITEKEILDEIQAHRKEKRMNEEFINEGYLDMLIQQSYSNEEKAGAKADSVASKLEMIKSQILQDHEIVNRLRRRLEGCKVIMAVHDDDFTYFYDLEKELQKLMENKK